MHHEQWWTVPVPKLLAGDHGLSPQARYLYMVLSSLADEAATVRISSHELMGHSAISSRALLARYLGQLEQAGWLSVAKGSGRRPTTYSLTRPPRADPSTVKVPVGLIRDQSLPMASKCLYAVLLALCAQDKPAVAIGRLELIRQAGIGNDNSVRSAARHLIQGGWLRVERNAKAKLFSYQPLDRHLAIRRAERKRAEQRLARKSFTGEALLKQMLTVLVADLDFVENALPGKVVNPYTGEPLEFDRLYTAAKVAFEFNGPQHERPTAAFPDPDKANQQRGRDLMKAGLAWEHKIELIVVKPHELTFQALTKKIGDLLPLRTLRLEDPLVTYLAARSRRYVRTVREGQF